MKKREWWRGGLSVAVILVLLLMGGQEKVRANVPLLQIPLGKVVLLSGYRFIKISDNQYLAVEPMGVTMQAWDGCVALPTPKFTVGIKSTYFTQGPLLVDARDGKRYEIRKFPDGKCWMVDNLRYGGATMVNGNVDVCFDKGELSGDDFRFA